MHTLQTSSNLAEKMSRRPTTAWSLLFALSLFTLAACSKQKNNIATNDRVDPLVGTYSGTITYHRVEQRSGLPPLVIDSSYADTLVIEKNSADVVSYTYTSVPSYTRLVGIDTNNTGKWDQNAPYNIETFTIIFTPGIKRVQTSYYSSLGGGQRNTTIGFVGQK